VLPGVTFSMTSPALIAPCHQREQQQPSIFGAQPAGHVFGQRRAGRILDLIVVKAS
jgi:hypothetical protein